MPFVLQEMAPLLTWHTQLCYCIAIRYSTDQGTDTWKSPDHVEILHATGNPFFAPVANVISASLESSLRVTNRQPADNHASLPVHQKVMKAIGARKPNNAQAAMRSLLNEAADRIESALGGV